MLTRLRAVPRTQVTQDGSATLEGDIPAARPRSGDNPLDRDEYLKRAARRTPGSDIYG